jgi:predicted amidohydrolase
VDRIRVASMQYFIRPIREFEQFEDQVSALVDTARDYKCGLAVFPEYFTLQLLTLGDTRRKIDEQVRVLASYVPRYVELMSGLAKRHGLYIAGGTIPVVDEGGDEVYNQAFLFAPSGKWDVQGKIHMTRFEREEWFVSPRSRLRVFETSFGRLAILICYDVEFPELARVAARAGARILLIPSCTDDRQGFYRVRYCAHARTIENQVYAVQSPTVGSLPMVPAVSLNYGQAAILTPSDFPFARDGILAEGMPNQETIVIGELNLTTINENRETGTVLPLRDSQHSSEVAKGLEEIIL